MAERLVLVSFMWAIVVRFPVVVVLGRALVHHPYWSCHQRDWGRLNYSSPKEKYLSYSGGGQMLCYRQPLCLITFWYIYLVNEVGYIVGQSIGVYCIGYSSLCCLVSYLHSTRDIFNCRINYADNSKYSLRFFDSSLVHSTVTFNFRHTYR